MLGKNDNNNKTEWGHCERDAHYAVGGFMKIQRRVSRRKRRAAKKVLHDNVVVEPAFWPTTVDIGDVHSECTWLVKVEQEPDVCHLNSALYHCGQVASALVVVVFAAVMGMNGYSSTSLLQVLGQQSTHARVRWVEDVFEIHELIQRAVPMRILLCANL